MKTTVVIPAYNAVKTLEKTVHHIPFECVDEIIIVDDGSKDGTAALADSLSRHYSRSNPQISFSVFAFDQNMGYGRNQKKCYELALARGADIIIMLHSDYQYDPRLIKHLRSSLEKEGFDVMLGSRIRSRKEASSGGMPAYKYFANRILSFFQNIITGRNLSEWHTGMRAYKRKVLENVPYEKFSNDFAFDSQMLFAIVGKDYSIGEIPVPIRYSRDSSSISFLKSVRYGLSTLMEAYKFLVRKLIRKTGLANKHSRQCN